MTVKDVFGKALEAEGVTGKLATLARSIYAQESGGGRNTTTSNRGAVGGMQILPGTFKSVADKDWSISDPEHNARAGIRYLKQLDKQAGGDPTLTAAGYYGGPGGLEKARKGIAVSDPKNPNAPNTLQYGAQVAKRAGLSREAVPASAPVQEATVAIPPAAAAGAPMAAVDVPASPGSMPLPQGILDALNVKTASAGPGPSPWAQFLAAMPSSKAPTVEDFSYGKGVPTLAFGPPPVVKTNPQFDAFKSWKAQV